MGDCQAEAFDFLIVEESDIGYTLDLHGADLRNAELSGFDLFRCILAGVNLSGADLREADLMFVSLDDADLSGANLQGATSVEDDRTDLTEELKKVKSLKGTVMPDGSIRP